MGKILILEGPDGSGKTTLADALVQRGWVKNHFGPPTSSDLLHTYAKALYDASLSDKNTVFDRLHLGETVYGPILRNRDLLGEVGIRILLRIINGVGGYVVIAMPPYEVAVANWRNRAGELFKDDAVYRQVYGAYQQIVFSGLHGAPACGTWDYSKVPLAIAIQNIEFVMKYRSSLPLGIIGSGNPRFLIVGEKANHTDLDLPFVSLTGSSEYLNECLVDAGFGERELAFVNARNLAGKPNQLASAWELIGEPYPILLGKVAKDAFVFTPCGSFIPHPAYWKRFKAGRRHEYVKMLRDIQLGAYRHATV